MLKNSNHYQRFEESSQVDWSSLVIETKIDGNGLDVCINYDRKKLVGELLINVLT